MNKIILIILLVVSSCAPVIIGATAITTKAIIQEKTVGNTVDDYTIWSKIKSAYLQNDINNLFHHIDVKVNEGRVLLTGYAIDAETRVKAMSIAWEQKGVNEVINEINIAESTNKLAIKDYSIDSWITTQIKTRLLVNKYIRSVNYNIETVDRTVYLFGIAQNEEESKSVSEIASTTKYVKHVINHVKLKDNS